MSQKGSQFEREVCRLLSKWWSKGIDDSWFWRASISGGRATVRGRKGLKTTGHYGDIAACCPEAQKLLDVVTIELKRGYSKYTQMDLVDKLVDGGLQVWEKWIKQASHSSDLAKTQGWWIISQRDRRQGLLTMPLQLWDAIVPGSGPDIIFDRFDRKKGLNLAVVVLDSFLKMTDPEDVLYIKEFCEKGK